MFYPLSIILILLFCGVRTVDVAISLQTSNLRRKPAIRVKTVSSSANSSSPGMYGMCGMYGMMIVSDVSRGVSHGVSQ